MVIDIVKERSGTFSMSWKILDGKIRFFFLCSHNFFLCKITDASPLIKHVCTLQTLNVNCFL